MVRKWEEILWLQRTNWLDYKSAILALRLMIFSVCSFNCCEVMFFVSTSCSSFNRNLRIAKSFLFICPITYQYKNSRQKSDIFRSENASGDLEPNYSINRPSCPIATIHNKDIEASYVTTCMQLLWSFLTSELDNAFIIILWLGIGVPFTTKK